MITDHLDHLGTAIASTNMSGAFLWREAYLPFGEKRLDPAGNRDKPAYTGHVVDSLTGLTYMQARYYDPVLGRFLSTDPVGYQDQLNLYAYVGNDPVNALDPNGEERVGLVVRGELFLRAGIRAEVKLGYDTTNNEIVGNVKIGAGVGGRIGVGIAGYSEPSQRDGSSVSGKLSVQAGAAADIDPLPLGGKISGELSLVEGKASTESGLTGDALVPKNTSTLNIGPLSISSDSVEAGGGFDVGAAASVDVDVGATVTIQPFVDVVTEDNWFEDVSGRRD